jgi:HAD superfamily hydrolase (TIGR01490 family)
MYAAFFDLDHTILNISSGQIMYEGSRRHGIIGRGGALALLAVVVLYRAGLFPPDAAVRFWMRWYAGMTVESMAPIAAEWAEEVKRYVREDARREIEAHRAAGGRTVILSASTPLFCGIIRDELGMDDVICTEVEIVDGTLTGRLAGRYCYGAEKLARAKAYCDEKGLDLADAYYYADSFADLRVLESVGHPVCVSPHPKLEREAQKRGWEVRGWQ